MKRRSCYGDTDFYPPVNTPVAGEAVVVSAVPPYTVYATPAGIDNSKLPLAGGTMTGDIVMGGNNITGAGTVSATGFSGTLTGHASLDLPLTGGSLTGTLSTKLVRPALANTYDFGSAALPYANGWFGQTVTAAGFTGALTGHASLDLPLTGGTMTGGLDMGSNAITSVTDPITAQGAATKNYVDSNAILASGINPMTGTFNMNTQTAIHAFQQACAWAEVHSSGVSIGFSFGVTPSRLGTGTYLMTFNTPLVSPSPGTSSYTANVTASWYTGGGPQLLANVDFLTKSTSSFIVYVTTPAGVLTDGSFDVVVFCTS